MSSSVAASAKALRVAAVRSACVRRVVVAAMVRLNHTLHTYANVCYNDPMAGILIEAEAFDDHGGWVMDSQFEVQMGSPYLLAHGMGRPVADATTVVTVPDAGDHSVWVRAKDWVPS